MIKPGTFDYTTRYFFPMRLMWGCYPLALGVLALYNGYYAVGVPLVLVGPLFFTLRFGVRIDTVKKTWQEYLWILGYRKGNTKSFDELTTLYIKKSMRDALNDEDAGFLGPKGFRGKEYDGYVLFPDERGIYLFSDKSKSELLKRMEIVSVDTGLGIIDSTEGEPAPAPDPFTNLRSVLYILCIGWVLIEVFNKFGGIFLVLGCMLIAGTTLLELVLHFRKK